MEDAFVETGGQLRTWDNANFAKDLGKCSLEKQFEVVWRTDAAG